MKKKQLFTILLSIVLTVSMCLAGTTAAFAGTDEGESAIVSSSALTKGITKSIDSKSNLRAVSGGYITPGTTIYPQELNSTKEETVFTAAKGSYTIDMPAAGILIFKYVGDVYPSSSYVSFPSTMKYADSMSADDGTAIKLYYCTKGTHVIEISPGSGNNYCGISALYASSAPKKVKLNSVYLHGTSDYNTVTKFQVTVPSTGYLTLTLGDGIGDEYFSIRAKTSGFKDYELFSSKDNVKWIGVKKGTYTFSVKSSSAIYGIKAKFTKVKESKYGSKKKKAVALKKKKTSKGLIITNAKKVHWYKFKNPKTQKVKVVVGTKITDAGGYGGIRVTAYYGKASTYRTIYSDTKSTSIQLYNKGTKLKKGTYYIKVESYSKGNGYFTVKWK